MKIELGEVQSSEDSLPLSQIQNRLKNLEQMDEIPDLEKTRRFIQEKDPDFFESFEAVMKYYRAIALLANGEKPPQVYYPGIGANNINPFGPFEKLDTLRVEGVDIENLSFQEFREAFQRRYAKNTEAECTLYGNDIVINEEQGFYAARFEYAGKTRELYAKYGVDAMTYEPGKEFDGIYTAGSQELFSELPSHLYKKANFIFNTQTFDETSPKLIENGMSEVCKISELRRVNMKELCLYLFGSEWRKIPYLAVVVDKNCLAVRADQP